LKPSGLASEQKTKVSATAVEAIAVASAAPAKSDRLFFIVIS
jgi:hypothetical protein